jgi:hypothetical protein
MRSDAPEKPPVAAQHSNSIAGDHAFEYAGDAIVMAIFVKGGVCDEPCQGAISRHGKATGIRRRACEIQ